MVNRVKESIQYTTQTQKLTDTSGLQHQINSLIMSFVLLIFIVIAYMVYGAGVYSGKQAIISLIKPSQLKIFHSFSMVTVVSCLVQWIFASRRYDQEIKELTLNLTQYSKEE
ncbi:Hypothetical_protein [Hexamita inflata]|uniref:Hypothetical_protein n=1 Tax=Hexamita inflata TaxID=28002 RepID=A0AA86TLU2_9EUKA|nr:Hypothetical protein HINF_LOCUS10154 [Hexamita inflata]